ncbi:MAG TPA: polymer-forming cytoskeletal protein [Woeseiaceae bacterium]|nr:polymer-forming cytoskeletal protein [Woeseiaceae bacterium]
MSDTKSRRLSDRSSGPATLISEACKVTGKMSGRGNFMISGQVEGDCDIEGTVTLAKTGRWKGTIKASTVIVAGTIDGDIDAAGHVEITDSARIVGTVAGEAIAVAEGAVVQGVMKTTGRSEPVEFVEKRQGQD